MALNMLLKGNQSKTRYFYEDVPYTVCLDPLLQSQHINKPEGNRTGIYSQIFKVDKNMLDHQL